MAESFRIRPAVQADGGFLGDMVVEAANWRGGGARPRHEVTSSAKHSRYLTGWMRPGDTGFVAEDLRGEPIGAAWYRMLPRSEPGFGWVGTGVPELIIGVRPIWRVHGVERDNFAVTLYRSEGFAVTQSGLGRDTMVKRLR